MNDKNILWPGWETVKMIGQGSFGSVYEIQRQVFDDVEKAALKVISIPQNDSDIDELYNDGYEAEDVTASFQAHMKSIVSEYSLMRKMSGSANIVNCDDIRYIQHDDGIGWDIFIKMELLTPLTRAIYADISDETVIHIAKDMCAALILCNKHEIVHRDIKPQNIFLSDNGDYKLGDFGIAKTVEKTMGGTKVGTYKYMAPEVYHNRPYGCAADLYSLGLVLYWLLNERRLPFLPLPPEKLKAGMEEDARQRRFSGEPLPPPAHGSEVLKKIVLKACAYDLKDRYTSAAEMLEDLHKMENGTLIVFGDQRDGGQVENDTHGPDNHTDDGPQKPQKVCAHCGGYLKEEMIFCVHCGCAVDAEPKDKGRKKPKARKYVWIAVAIVILALLLKCCGDRKPDSNMPTDPTTAPTQGYTEPAQLNWSEWTDQLPANISADQYEIESRTLYRSKTLETATSTETNTMDGWELYDTIAADGGYGPWSKWSETPVEASSTRQVKTETRYRYQDKETTTGYSPNMDGWTLGETTYTWGEYGPWSEWSETPAYNSDSRQVATKTQYNYRNISYSTYYTDYGAWSGWQDNPVTANDLQKVETQTVWGYYYFRCPGCGGHMYGWGIPCYQWAGGCGYGNIPENSWVQVYKPVSWDSAGLTEFHGTGKYVTYIDGERLFKWNSGGSKIQYRYATRSLQQRTNYGSWSGWGDTAYSASANRQVETRTVYSYCDRPQVAVYHFYRWGEPSNWSADAITPTDDRMVESKVFYQYCDQVQSTTYCFRRWTDWSDYAEGVILPSETVEVESITQYRYKSK